MDAPFVRIERQSLLTMLLAAVETYDRECYGITYGHKPTRRRNYYHISVAIPRQRVIRRTSAEVVTSDRADNRVEAFTASSGKLYLRQVGDFHSHPAHAGGARTLCASVEDVRDMKSKDGRRRPVGIIINIIRRGKRNAPWRRLNHRTRLRGSLGGFTFDVMAYHIVGEGIDAAPEALVIRIAPSVRRALNKARKAS